MINGNDSAFNSLNPFVSSEPPYYSTFMMGNAGGALSKTGSWFGSVFDRNNQSNSIINAEVPDHRPAATTTRRPSPIPSRASTSARVSTSSSANNTLTVRYMFDRQSKPIAASPSSPWTPRATTPTTKTPCSSATPRCSAPTSSTKPTSSTCAIATTRSAQEHAHRHRARRLHRRRQQRGPVRDTQDHYELQNYTTVR